MCGIFAAIGSRPLAETLIEGLRRLEYRGYDSAGIAVLGSEGLRRICTVGNVSMLAERVESETVGSRIGIGHTRWATHGSPSAENAHPHLAPGVAVVHNGIIENHRELRDSLSRAGCQFRSETDTEVIPWLISRDLKAGRDVQSAMRNLSTTLHGSYAIAVLAEDDPHTIHAKRLGSPLAVAIGPEGGYVASDVTACTGFATEAVLLEDHDQVALHETTMVITDAAGRRADRRSVKLAAYIADLGRGNYSHFMHKEIHEQSEVSARIGAYYADHGSARLAALDFRRIRRILMIACGTSFHACMVAKRWFAEVAGIAADVEIASEFRYSTFLRSQGELAILVSQSGETADTLAALRSLRQLGMPTLGIVNQEYSTLAREATFCLPLLAGPEIGVASTKAFVAQLLVLAQVVVHVAGVRGRLPHAVHFLDQLRLVPDLVADTLADEPQVIGVAQQFRKVQSAILLGRGSLYPIALEGALKLKEISYIHAEGFAAGELKHGPIALIDRDMLIVALAPTGETFPKIASNIREIAARGGRVMVVGDQAAIMSLADVATSSLIIPTVNDLIQPILATIPLQLLAYHVAAARGCDVDRPRNLAKSVTVE